MFHLPLLLFGLLRVPTLAAWRTWRLRHDGCRGGSESRRYLADLVVAPGSLCAALEEDRERPFVDWLPERSFSWSGTNVKVEFGRLDPKVQVE